MINKDSVFFVFDVESIGLHGQGYAVAGGVYKTDGTVLDEFVFSCKPVLAEGNADDRKWVRDNIPEITLTHPCPEQTGLAFWNKWMDWKKEFPDIIMAAECGWPVEARFLTDIIDRDLEGRKWNGPYPLHEIATFMLAAGMDPMANYERLPDELPKHDPMADVRQSKRLLLTAFQKLGLIPAP